MSQPAPAQLTTPAKRKTTVGDVVFAAFMCALVLAYFTNPSEAAMRKAMEDRRAAEQSAFTYALSNLAMNILDVRFDYHNYLLFSTMTVRYRDNEARFMWGCFGHIGWTELPKS